MLIIIEIIASFAERFTLQWRNFCVVVAVVCIVFCALIFKHCEHCERARGKKRKSDFHFCLCSVTSENFWWIMNNFLVCNNVICDNFSSSDEEIFTWHIRSFRFAKKIPSHFYSTTINSWFLCNCGKRRIIHRMVLTTVTWILKYNFFVHLFADRNRNFIYQIKGK